jgi:Spy/CpxP family protein refolding chaperone
MPRQIVFGLAYVLIVFASALAAAQFADSPDVAPRKEPSRPPAANRNQLVVPGYWLLGIKRIQEEVGLTDDQLQDLKDISKKYQTALKRITDQLENLSQQEKKSRMAEVRQQTTQLVQSGRKKAETVLTPQQVQKLKQIDLQLRVAGMLMDSRAQENLGLSNSQRKRLGDIYQSAQDKAQQLQRETGERILGVLQPEQEDKLRQQIREQGW